MRRLALVGLILLSTASLARAQQLEWTNGLACGMFEKTKEGYWRARTYVILWCGAPMSSRTLVQPGGIYCGGDLSALLDEACGQ